jgi:hypothetical protein
MEIKDKIILQIANMTLSEMTGSSVHPCEKFDPVECYLASMDENKLISYINAGIDNYIIDGDNDFYINEDLTFFKFGEIEGDYDDFIHFNSLDVLISTMNQQVSWLKYYEENPKKMDKTFENKRKQYEKVKLILEQIPKLKEFFDTIPKWRRKRKY